MGAERSELRLGGEGEFDLQVPGKQEDPIDRRSGLHVEEIDGFELRGQVLGPVGEHFVDACATDDAEGEGEVGPPIS